MSPHLRSLASRTGLAAGACLPLLLAAASPSRAEDAKIDTGDTAWMLVSIALVLLMTIPGLALFYAGMVRKKNVLATMMQTFAICCLVSVLWMVVGYSLAFGNGGPFVGDFSRAFLSGIVWDKPFTLGTGKDAVATTIPETVFMMFQLTFAAITPALICGAVADRMKFSAMLWFMGLWSLAVYAPIAHMVWHPNGWLFGDGVLDFAGGTVVHINAGIAGLMASLMLGKRRGYGHDNFAPYNLTLAVIGASLLWVGWFGFNAGSATGASARAGMAMLVTHLGAAAAALGWAFAEWAMRGKPSVLGIVSGAVAGLVAITPASGYVFPVGALVIGAVAGVACFLSATHLKRVFGYDDSLDVFGVHGVGGIIGALLTGLLAVGVLSATSSNPEGSSGSLAQLWIQAKSVVVTLVYSGVVTLILLKIIDATLVLRVSDEDERDGLDLSLHGEAVQ